MGETTPVTHVNPCPVCGKPDMCFYRQGQNGPLLYCGREESVLCRGHNLIQVRVTKNHYTVYEDREQYNAAREAYIEKKKAENPNYKPVLSKRKKNPVAAEIGRTYIDRSNYTKDYIEDTNTAEVIDKVYRAFLSLLVLREKHKLMLLKEWGEDIFNKIISRYPIVSMPKTDKERFEFGEYNESPWRKKIMDTLLTMVSEDEIKGTPGFYQLGNGSWTFSKLSGIIFPTYNSKGQITPLRIRDDFPVAEGFLKGKEGVFFFSDKHYGWCFKELIEKPDRGPTKFGIPELVYQPKKHINLVMLDGNGIPLSTTEDGATKKSKVSGKYKNFSSFKEIADDEKKRISNYYLNGCRAGSPISLYAQPGDDYTVCYFTEGEKKAMIANLILKIPVVDFPGVNTYGKVFEPEKNMSTSLMDYLKSKGMKCGVLAYDADKSTNIMVLRAEKNCVNQFVENDIQLAVGSWNASFGKGLDDILLTGVRPSIHFLQ